MNVVFFLFFQTYPFPHMEGGIQKYHTKKKEKENNIPELKTQHLI